MRSRTLSGRAISQDEGDCAQMQELREKSSQRFEREGLAQSSWERVIERVVFGRNPLRPGGRSCQPLRTGFKRRLSVAGAVS